MERDAIERWVSSYAQCWKEKDARRVVDLFTENAVYRSSPFRDPHVGREAIRDYWIKATRSQDDFQIKMGLPICEENRATVEWWASWTEEEKPITLPGCLILRFAPNGQCEELREYWHSDTATRAPPEGWGL